MNTRELLYELFLTNSPNEKFGQTLQTLLGSAAGSVLYSTSIIDVLVFCLIRQDLLSDELKRFLSLYVSKHSHSVPLPVLHVQLITQLVGRLELNMEIFNPTKQPSSRAIDYYAASRALLTGTVLMRRTFNQTRLARDACFALHCCDFVRSFHTLQCLKGVATRESTRTTLVKEFALGAERHLSQIVKLYPSPILMWEQHLLKKLTPKEN